MSQQVTTTQGELTADSLRCILQEHHAALVSQFSLQQARFSDEVDAKIDAKVRERIAVFKMDEESFKASMIEAVAASTQSAFDTMSSNLSERMTTTVKAEVSALDVKFRALLDSSSSVHSGSQALSLSSQQSARSTLDSGNRQVWRCPVCQFPLKHEKSFHDHMLLLQSRIHEMPVVHGKRRSKKVKKCLFNIERPELQLLLQPWADTEPTFWSQAHEFVRHLLCMLKPGTEQATHNDNPRHVAVFQWIDDCRNGVFKPNPCF